MANTIKLESLESTKIKQYGVKHASEMAPIANKVFESLTNEQRSAIVGYFYKLHEENLYAFEDFLRGYKSKKFENLPSFIQDYFLSVAKHSDIESMDTGDAFVALWFFDNMSKKGDLPETIINFFEQHFELASKSFASDKFYNRSAQIYRFNPIRVEHLLSMIKNTPFAELSDVQRVFVEHLFDYNDDELPYQTVADMADYVQSQFALDPASKEASTIQDAFAAMPEMFQNFVKKMYVACVARQETVDAGTLVSDYFKDNDDGTSFNNGFANEKFNRIKKNYVDWASFNKGFAGVPDQYDCSELYSPCDQLIFRNLLYYAKVEEAFVESAKKLGRGNYDVFTLVRKIAQGEEDRYGNIAIEGIGVGNLTEKRGHVYYYGENEVFPCNKTLVLGSFDETVDLVNAETKNGSDYVKNNFRNYKTIVNNLAPVFDGMIKLVVSSAEQGFLGECVVAYLDENNLTKATIDYINSFETREEMADCLKNLYTASKPREKRTSRQKKEKVYTSAPYEIYDDGVNINKQLLGEECERSQWDYDDYEDGISILQGLLTKNYFSKQDREGIAEQFGFYIEGTTLSEKERSAINHHLEQLYCERDAHRIEDEPEDY